METSLSTTSSEKNIKKVVSRAEMIALGRVSLIRPKYCNWVISMIRSEKRDPRRSRREEKVSYLLVWREEEDIVS